VSAIHSRAGKLQTVASGIDCMFPSGRGVDYNPCSMKVRDAIKRLEQDGWRIARTKGSHRQFHHPTKPGTVTVAGHPSVDIPPGTLNNILKQAGLK
jgi:predicted RNA binding protein YcfA (HicA-like mRNA interferase family)